MTDVIAQYQKWKEQGESLRAQAKQAMEARFRELLSEAAQIAEEYRRDFGGALKPAAPITAFRYKAVRTRTRKAERKTAAKKLSSKTLETPAHPEAKTDKKVARLQKRLSTAKSKLAAAKA